MLRTEIDRYGEIISVIPLFQMFTQACDRSKEASKYFYPKGSYTVKELNGVSRPVPYNSNTKPIVRLIRIMALPLLHLLFK
jgi:hypothetical protein